MSKNIRAKAGRLLFPTPPLQHALITLSGTSLLVVRSRSNSYYLAEPIAIKQNSAPVAGPRHLRSIRTAAPNINTAKNTGMTSPVGFERAYMHGDSPDPLKHSVHDRV